MANLKVQSLLLLSLSSTLVISGFMEMDNGQAGRESLPCPYSPEDVSLLLSSLDRMVNSFYLDEYRRILEVRKGALGLGVLRGQLTYILGERREKLSFKLKRFLEDLHHTAGHLGHAIVHQILTSPSLGQERKYETEVIRNNSHILHARFRDWIPANRLLQDQLSPEVKEGEIQTSGQGLACLLPLLRDCSLPSKCKGPLTRFTLLDQILFLHSAQRRACLPLHPQEEAFRNLERRLDLLCAQVLHLTLLDLKGLSSRAFIGEGVGLCGLIGYPNFFSNSLLLRKILSWVGQKGYVSALQGEESIDLDLTSVTLMSLALHLRYILDACPHEILQVNY